MMLEPDLLELLKQLAQTIDHHPDDIATLENLVAQISGMLNERTSLVNDPQIKHVLRLFGMGINLIGKEKAIRRFKEQGESLVPPWELATDLDSLSGDKVSDTAASLRAILEETQLDAVNQKLRHRDVGGDYEYAPYPMKESYLSYGEILKRVNKKLADLKPENLDLKRAYLAYLFFTLGHPITFEDLVFVFGKERQGEIMPFFTSGLFIIAKDRQVKMNSLAISSLTLEGKTIYLLFDLSIKPESSTRVYLGGDSWSLLKFLLSQNSLAGTGVDLGSGTGVQGIGCVLFHNAVEKMVLFDIDRRSCNVAQFNAFLNGVQEKIEIVSSEEDLKAKLGASKASFIVTNPPFMPLPDFIELTDELARGIPSDVVEQRNGSPGINVKNLYIKAGWGGTDGLTVIKDFLKLAAELGDKGTKVMIFSPVFAANSHGNLLLEKFVTEEKGWHFHFELTEECVIPRKSDRNFVNPSKLNQNDGADLMAQLIREHLVSVIFPILVFPLELYIKDKIQAEYKHYGIHEFYNGVATITL